MTKGLSGHKFIAITGLSLAALLFTSPAPAGDEPPTDPVMVAKLNEANLFPERKTDFRLEINEKYQFYDVMGASASDLRQQMSLNGTQWDDGETYDALTTWEIKYSYKTTTENDRCFISSASTNVGITYRFPRWINSAKAAGTLLSHWTGYIGRLKIHECGHKDLTVNAAREINDGLSGLGSFSSCKELDKAARALAHEKLARLKKAQRDYDSTTRHGETQGAVFP